MQDVKRLALSALNSAAHHKAHLLKLQLPTLLPLLYQDMIVDPGLIRVVEMGPFKIRVDDGLDARKVGKLYVAL